MSEEASIKIPSNGEIIDEVTKELHDIQFRVQSPASEKDHPESSSHIPEDFDNSDTETDKMETVEEISDESDIESLKNEELDLTDEEKEEKRQKAFTLKNLGNEEFKNGDYQKSIHTYSQALKVCPLKYSNDRSVLYANRAASKLKHDKYLSVIKDCDKAINLNNKYVKAYVRRAKAYEHLEKYDECAEDYKMLIELDPQNVDMYNLSHQRVTALINERNEKLKTEMIGKLKDLGNLFLRPFGLSTDNFQVQEDPNTGGYSVNFQQNH